jgi:hypothetical protein
VTPGAGADDVDPAEPLVVRFDQVLTADAVGRLLRLTTADGAPVPFTVALDPDDPHVARLTARFDRDRAYALELPAGSLGSEGELPTAEDQGWSFRTYPPLTVVRTAPEGEATADPWLELSFSTPVPGKEVAAHLTLTPTPEGWAPPSSSWAWTSWGYGIGLAPHTTYTATVSAGMRDEHGQTLAAPVSWTFTTGDREPTWGVPSGVHLYPANNPKEVPIRHRNLGSLVVRAAPLRAADVLTDAPPDRIDGPPQPVAIDGPRNVSELDALDLTPLLNPDGFGWIGADFFTPDLDWGDDGARSSSVLVVTDLGATVKLAPGATEVFVTSLATGAPVEGVAVSLRYAARDPRTDDLVGEDPIPLGQTGPDGWLRAEGQPSGAWSRWERPLAVLLKKGADESVVFADWAPDWGWFANEIGRAHV